MMYISQVIKCFLSNHNIYKKYYQHGGMIAGIVYKIKKCRWRAMKNNFSKIESIKIFIYYLLLKLLSF